MPPSGLSYNKNYGSQLRDQHEPYSCINNRSFFSLCFSSNNSYNILDEGGGDILTTSVKRENTAVCNSSSIINGISQMENVLNTAQHSTQEVVMREFGFMPLTMTKQIYYSSNNAHIECRTRRCI